MTKRVVVPLGCLAAAVIVILAMRLYSSVASDAAIEATPSKTVLVVAAASSLKESLDEIARAYEAATPGIRVTFTYGSSGTLQKQIVQGAPADLFVSAGQQQMEALEKAALVSKPKILLTNSLVLIVPADSAFHPDDLKNLSTAASVKSIAIGQPETVPAGQYAMEALTSAGIWTALQPKLIFTKDVRQALTYVETGNVDAGFVYRTDALSLKKTKIALPIADGMHKPIVYPGAVIKSSAHRAAAERLMDYLGGAKARHVFESHGFGIPAP